MTQAKTTDVKVSDAKKAGKTKLTSKRKRGTGKIDTSTRAGRGRGAQMIQLGINSGVLSVK